MLVRPMLLHRMALVSVQLFCKNLGNLQEFFGQMVYCPLWQKIARTPMPSSPYFPRWRKLVAKVQGTRKNRYFPRLTLLLPLSYQTTEPTVHSKVLELL